MTNFYIVFDIDETLLHVLSEEQTYYWNNLTHTQKNKIKKTVSIIEKDINIIFLRPYINTLFKYFTDKKNNIFKIAIWTYGEIAYANYIKDILVSMFDLSEDFFLFVWGVENIHNHKTPKNLKDVYLKFPECNTSNTFLVDNIYSNISHPSNIENSILISSFHPFQQQTQWTKSSNIPKIIENFTKDKEFKNLLQLCKKLNKYSNKLQVQYSIFSEENVQNMHLQKIIKNKLYSKTHTFVNVPNINNKTMKNTKTTNTQVKNTKKIHYTKFIQ